MPRLPHPALRLKATRMSKGNGKGVVAAGHELTAKAAAEILEDGGNAFDACVAGLFMTFVAEAVFSSPGGGGFLMARRAGSDRVTLFDFFAETPLRHRPSRDIDFYPIYADFGPAKQEFHIGAGSAATPGVVPGIFAMHEELCRLPMKRLVEPAIRAAREGFTLTSFQAYLLTVIAPILIATPGVARIFAPGGTLLEAGATFANPDLGECIEWLSEDGARLFVDGDVGQAIVREQRDGGGYLTHDDLASYDVARRKPILWQHAGATVALNPPPAASGALIAFGLAYLQALKDEGRALDALALKEAMAATNEARASHGEGLAEKLAEGALPRKLRAASRHPSANRGTTHISVIDRDGNAAAASLSNGEGNGAIVGNFGFMLNNMLGEEDLAPEGLGKWREGMRLSSMMSPTIILRPDGVVVALGTGGSNRIRTAILQVAVNMLDHGMSLEDAVEAPRLHLEKCGTLSFEPGLPEAVQSAFLAQPGDVRAWPERNLFFGGVHAARRFGDGGVEGAGDPRRGGVAIVV
jgi:gamma-glutamyltranspeptidase / glutathione hydrolase